MTNTIDSKEVLKFSKLSEKWWDEDGEFKILHEITPVRISYFKEKIIQHFNLDPKSLTPFENLKLIDVGCGGGLVSQPMAKLGASVTAIDASAENIHTAINHNRNKVDYQHTTIEEIAKTDQKYDCVLAIEIIEHVANLDQFIKSCASVLAPGGTMIISTINQNIKSYLKAIIVAEYILKWVPTDTHDWQKFIKPSNLANHLRDNKMKIIELKGLNYNLISRDWYLSDQIDTNYIAICEHI
jgi:2-polyprenyl-6-hydroxyphenyl methylase/3-demethylubiquinone-9 3-methyltransferase